MPGPVIQKGRRNGCRAARRVGGWLRRGWAAHGARLARNSSYLTATAIALSGLVGGVPLPDVVATVLCVVMGVDGTGLHTHSGRGASWHDDPFDPVTLA